MNVDIFNPSRQLGDRLEYMILIENNCFQGLEILLNKCECFFLILIEMYEIILYTYV